MGVVVTDVVVIVVVCVAVVVAVDVFVVVWHWGQSGSQIIDVDRTIPFYKLHQILISNVPESNTVFMHDCTLFAILWRNDLHIFREVWKSLEK